MLKARKLIIAIDGPAGSGKSSTAKALAKRLKVPFIDTGAMYRAVTLKAMQKGVSLTDTRKLIALSKTCRIRFAGNDPEKQRVILDGKDVSKAIRLPELTKNVVYIARETLIRRVMVQLQRKLGKKSGGVMEGRDIGTMVFPDADFKLYFKASDAIRARRRYRELVEAGHKATTSEVLKDIKRRDKSDYERKEGPLRCAKDALVIDTTSLTIQDTVDKILQIIQSNPLKHGKLNKSAS